MYSIEYYQNERSKPTIEIPNYSSDNRKRNSMKRRAYLRRKDVIDKCGNIQSLTIDVADIKNVLYDDRLKHLRGLYARINGLNINDVKTIKIFNDNSVNLLYIYEIINCDWMINKGEIDYSEELLIEKIKELYLLITEYEKSNNPDDKVRLKDKIHLFKYWINSLNARNNTQNSDEKVLKIGNHVINKYKRASC